MGNSLTEFEVKYHISGQIKEIASKKVEDSVTTNSFTEYDKNGNLLKTVIEDSTGYYSSTENKYDKNASLTEQLYQNQHNSNFEKTSTKAVNN